MSDSWQPHGCTHQAPLPMGLPRQEYQSGLPFPSPGDFPNLGIKPASLALQVDFLPLSHLGSPRNEFFWTSHIYHSKKPFHPGTLFSLCNFKRAIFPLFLQYFLHFIFFPLLLLLLSHVSRVRLCATSQMAAH